MTDDTSARTFANMIGVVLWAAAVGNLQHDDAKVAIERLAQSSLWISQTILEEAYKALEEMYGFYLDD